MTLFCLGNIYKEHSDFPKNSLIFHYAYTLFRRSILNSMLLNFRYFKPFFPLCLWKTFHLNTLRSRQASFVFTSPVLRSNSIIKHSKWYWRYYKKSKNTDDPNWNIFLIELCHGYSANWAPLLSRIPKFSPLKFLLLDISSNYQFSNRPGLKFHS